MSLAYCPTDTMVVDYFTKPLQGTKFRKFWAMIMNHWDWAIELVSQECVGASTDNVNQEEKDLQDPGSGNNTRVTPALEQLGSGGENAKELPDKADFTGESKVYAVSSRRPKTDVASKGYTLSGMTGLTGSNHGILSQKQKGSLFIVKVKTIFCILCVCNPLFTSQHSFSWDTRLWPPLGGTTRTRWFSNTVCLIGIIQASRLHPHVVYVGLR